MFTQERHNSILDILAAQGRVSVIDLAEKLGVSDDTVRRDLKVLSDNGFLQKIHGGAVTLAVSQMSRIARQQLLPDVKCRIGASVAAKIQEGQTITLDSGTTTLAVAEALPRISIRVITNSLDVATVLADRPEIELIVAGGNWDIHERIFSGAQTLRALSTYRADVAVIGVCAINEQLAVTVTQEADAAIKRTMMDISTTKFLVADHSKFGQNAPYFLADISEFDEIFTDHSIQISSERPLINLITAHGDAHGAQAPIDTPVHAAALPTSPADVRNRH